MSEDKRKMNLNGLPATALQPGFWECNVDGNWVPYAWPTSSIIELAFCNFRDCVDFVYRGIDYRICFENAFLDSGSYGAQQANKKTGMKRAVQRWPSRHHKSCDAQRKQAEVRNHWGVWLEATWSWTLLDEKGTDLSESMAARLQSPSPPKVSYSLGEDCRFDLPWWPDLLRSWPTRDLFCAAHPLGQRCNFAMQRVAPSDEGPEWGLLLDRWNTGGLASSHQLLCAYRIQNRGLIHSFAAMRHAMLARLASEDFKDGVGRQTRLIIQMLWHGTRSASQLLDICSDGFDRSQAQTCLYGKGCYFATSATYSNKYACPVMVPGAACGSLRAMLLVAVLVGETTPGTSNMYPPPVKPHSKTGERFENTVDKVASPSIFVTYKDHQALPLYVMIYEA